MGPSHPRPVAHQGPARLCIQDQREALAAQALNCTARHILGGGPVRPRDVLPRCYPPSSADRRGLDLPAALDCLRGLGFLDLHVEPTSITQSTRLPDSNLASDDQCAAIVVSG